MGRNSATQLKTGAEAPHEPTADLGGEAVAEISVALNHLNDVATASLIENWIDESERRTWFLSEIVSGS